MLFLTILNDMKKMFPSVTWSIEKELVTQERPRTERDGGILGNTQLGSPNVTGYLSLLSSIFHLTQPRLT